MQLVVTRKGYMIPKNGSGITEVQKANKTKRDKEPLVTHISHHGCDWSSGIYLGPSHSYQNGGTKMKCAFGLCVRYNEPYNRYEPSTYIENQSVVGQVESVP
jgi:hypothetical protein